MAYIKSYSGVGTRKLPFASQGDKDIGNSLSEVEKTRKSVVLRYVRAELKRMSMAATPFPDNGVIAFCEKQKQECIKEAESYGISEETLKQRAEQDIKVIVAQSKQKCIEEHYRNAEHSCKTFYKKMFESYYGYGVRY